MTNDPKQKVEFSRRYGLQPLKEMQVKSIDTELRTSLWNVLNENVLSRLEPRNNYQYLRSYASIHVFYYSLWRDFFRRSVDVLEAWSPNDAYIDLRKYFFEAEWYQLYDLLEFLLSQSSVEDPPAFEAALNFVLEREYAGYRFISGIATRMTSEQETETIKAALALEGPVAVHLTAALKLLSDREKPYYRNSIKESISAVEAFLNDASGEPKAKFHTKMAKVGANLPPAFQRAAEMLYGWTSDDAGIRHALKGDDTADSPLAHFMLVTCSAYINLLKAKRAEHAKGTKQRTAD